MNATGKRKFIRDLCRRVKDDALAQVSRMPAEWDGIELRHYLADKFGAQAITMSRTSPEFRALNKRYREYKNEVLVKNL